MPSESPLTIPQKLQYHLENARLRLTLTPKIELHYKGKPHARPAYDSENAYGFTGLSEDYHLPCDKDGKEMTPAAFEKQIMLNRDSLHQIRDKIDTHSNPPKHLLKLKEKYSQQLHGWLDEIIEKNPQISGISTLGSMADSEPKLWNTLMGISSGFNIKDIEWFVTGNNGISSRVSPGYHKTRQRLDDTVGHMPFVPSPSTLKTIVEQTIERPEHWNLDPKHTFSVNANTAPQDLTLLSIDGQNELITLPSSNRTHVHDEFLTTQSIIKVGERTDKHWQDYCAQRTATPPAVTGHQK